MLKLGLLVNPQAGVGGPAAMKGSDGGEAQRAARSLGVKQQAVERARATFAELARMQRAKLPVHRLKIVTLAAAMGQDVLRGHSGQSPAYEKALEKVFEVEVLSAPSVPVVTTAQHTKAGAKALAPLVDLLVFVGGDGTARDVLDALTEADLSVPVLGIPAGVKMHSGVFATSPGSAAQLLGLLMDGGLVAVHEAQIKDIDETALRRGDIGSMHYGELLVPSAGGYLQHVKSAGREVEALVLLEIAAEVDENFSPALELGTKLVLGPGSTCMAIKEQLLSAERQQQPTLLGVDVIADGKLLIKDATAPDLEALQATGATLEVFVSFSRGQGFVLGRGNQQLSPAFLAHLPENAFHIVSSRTKLATLEGRPLMIDSGADAIDHKFAGLRSIISGYQDRLLYLAQPA